MSVWTLTWVKTVMCYPRMLDNEKQHFFKAGQGRDQISGYTWCINCTLFNISAVNRTALSLACLLHPKSCFPPMSPLKSFFFTWLLLSQKRFYENNKTKNQKMDQKYQLDLLILSFAAFFYGAAVPHLGNISSSPSVIGWRLARPVCLLPQWIYVSRFPSRSYFRCQFSLIYLWWPGLEFPLSRSG